MSAYENVFGHDVQFDANGQPIEKGIGALRKVEDTVAHVIDPGVFKERDALLEEVAQLNADLAAVHAERDALAAQVITMTDQLKALAPPVVAPQPQVDVAAEVAKL